MSKSDHKNQSVATPPEQKQGDAKEVIDAKAALQGHEPVGANIEIHTDSHKIDDGHFVDANGARILFKDGKPIPQDQVFMAQSVRQEGYWKAGRQFGVVPTEIVFKSLSAQQQRALLDAKDTVLVVTRKS